MRKHVRFALFALVAAVLWGGAAQAQETFSIDIASGSPFAPGDILAPPAPAVVLPDVAIAAAGALGGAEIDGLSDGMDVFAGQLLFSVDFPSAGLPATAVAAEVAGAGLGPFDHPADVFSTPLTGVNRM